MYAECREQWRAHLESRLGSSRNPRVYAVTAGNQQFLEVGYYEEDAVRSTGAAWFRAALLMVRNSEGRGGGNIRYFYPRIRKKTWQRILQ